MRHTCKHIFIIFAVHKHKITIEYEKYCATVFHVFQEKSKWLKSDTVSCSHLSLRYLQCLLLEFTLFLLVSSEISNGPYTNNLLPFIKCCCTSKILLQLLLYSHLFHWDRLLCFHCIFLFFSFPIFSDELSVAQFLNIYFFLLCHCF